MKRLADILKRRPRAAASAPYRGRGLVGENVPCWEAGCLKPTARYGPDEKGNHPWYCRDHAAAHGYA